MSTPYGEVGVERIAMSTKEVQRGSVLAQVAARKLLLTAAARVLGVSYRQAKRLYRRYKAVGRVGLRHGNVGRRSNRAWTVCEQVTVLALIRAHYSGSVSGAGARFGPTLAAEHLWAEHGHLIPVPTLRRWMLGAELWSRQRRARPVHVRRPRREAFGELIQLDGSFHDWFEGRGPRPCLMSLVDDATGTMLGRFGEAETTWGAAEVLRAWIGEYGVPQALYTDAKTVYVREATSVELATGQPARTQFGQMCARLGIQLITARSPEAKGRIERNHGTSQDRLVKQMRLQHIATIADANQFLTTTYLAAHNRRFAVPAASGLDAHTRLRPSIDLADVFCLETTRQLGNDWVVRYANQALQVTPTRAARRQAAPGRRVLVRERADGGLRIVVRDPLTTREHTLAWTPIARGAACTPPVRAPAPPPLAIAIASAAGYTRSGKPLSAKQLAVRARWTQQITVEQQQRAVFKRVNEKRQAAAPTTASVTPA